MKTYIVTMHASDANLTVTNASQLSPTQFTPISTVTVNTGVSMANLNYQTFGSYVSRGVAEVIATPAPLGPLIAALTSLVGSSIEAKKAASFCCGAQVDSPHDVSLTVNGSQASVSIQGTSIVTGAAGASSGLVISHLMTSAIWTNLFNSLIAGDGSMTKLVTLAADDTLRIQLVGDFYYTPSGSASANKQTFGIVMNLKT